MSNPDHGKAAELGPTLILSRGARWRASALPAQKKEVIESGDWENLQINFLDKVDACNKTAWELTEKGLSFIAAQNLHI